MGQYYKVVNVDKKEFLSPWSFDNGSKLMEWSWKNNALTNAMLTLMARRWVGDRVYVVGDYAEADDPSETFYETLKSLGEEFGPMKNDEGEFIPFDLYRYANENFTEIEPSEELTRDNGYRYIYNGKLKVYLDLEKLPITNIYRCADGEPHTFRIFPLSLLLAMGNGRGGGDYWEEYPSYELVGSWCASSEYIIATKNVIEEIHGEFEEFAPNFTEAKGFVPWDTSLEEAVRIIKEGNE